MRVWRNVFFVFAFLGACALPFGLYLSQSSREADNLPSLHIPSFEKDWQLFDKTVEQAFQRQDSSTEFRDWQSLGQHQANVLLNDLRWIILNQKWDKRKSKAVFVTKLWQVLDQRARSHFFAGSMQALQWNWGNKSGMWPIEASPAGNSVEVFDTSYKLQIRIWPIKEKPVEKPPQAQALAVLQEGVLAENLEKMRSEIYAWHANELKKREIVFLLSSGLLLGLLVIFGVVYNLFFQKRKSTPETKKLVEEIRSMYFTYNHQTNSLEPWTFDLGTSFDQNVLRAFDSSQQAFFAIDISTGLVHTAWVSPPHFYVLSEKEHYVNGEARWFRVPSSLEMTVGAFPLLGDECIWFPACFKLVPLFSHV